MPDLASRKDASTSWVLFPIDETTPIPVTTTRFMIASLQFYRIRRGLGMFAAPSGPARLQCGVLAEQTDLEIARPIDQRAVRRKPAVGDAEHELRAHHPLDVDAVDHLLHRR